MSLTENDFDLAESPSFSAVAAPPQVVDDWLEPQAINDSLLPVDSLPEKLIPEPFRDWITDAAHRMQSPPEFIAIPVIILTGSLVGTKCAIKPKERDDWMVVPNLWGSIIGSPSSLKTPCMNEAFKPLAKLEKNAKDMLGE
jgi:hypothetical protein